MRYFLIIILLCLGCNSKYDNSDPLQVKLNNEYCGYIKLEDVSIRLLVLKHSIEKMADDDAQLAVQAANLASSKGLRIRDIGNHFINKDGSVKRVMWSRKYTIEELKNFVSEQMKVGSEPGDTLVIFTIGHGSRSGYLDNIGQREILMDVLATAAEEREQQTFWWQLSCHAAAKLPKISDLNQTQQDLFSMYASSPAHLQSAAYEQGKFMEKVFIALAENDIAIDPDRDEVITAGELASFMNKKISKGMGSRVFAKSRDKIVFGIGSLARMIPIVDKNNPQIEYPKKYIPLPRR